MRDMKDSGIPFIGSVPSNWYIDKIKHHLLRYERRNPGDKQILSVYREYGVIPKDSRNDNHNVTSEDTSKYKYVIPGYFVINKMKAWQGSMGISNYEGVVSPAYYVYKFKSHAFYHKYLHYLLRAVYKDEFRRLSGGIREGQWDLPAYSFENSRVLIPTYYEQQAIANFLDAKCTEIDALSQDLQEQITTLEQYKRSVIFEAVTKGLDKNAAMKDSGIDWIKNIPATWNIMRLKTIISLRQGGDWGENPQNNDNDVICLRIADFDFEKGKFKKKSVENYTWRNYPSSKISSLKLHKGDIIIEKSGGGEKTPVGRAVVFDMDVTATFANFSDKLVINKKYASPYFIGYYWRTMYYNCVTKTYIKQTIGIQNLDLSSLLNREKLAIPPIEEQHLIVNYLDSKCAEIDAAIAKSKEQLEVLAEYKKSLIYEYVTGKKEVPPHE